MTVLPSNVRPEVLLVAAQALHDERCLTTLAALNAADVDAVGGPIPCAECVALATVALVAVARLATKAGTPAAPEPDLCDQAFAGIWPCALPAGHAGAHQGDELERARARRAAR